MKKAIKILLLLFFALVSFVFGPDLIHSVYRFKTPDMEVQKRREDYSRLENQEFHLSQQAKIESVTERYKLFLWFHARGLTIDEGDNEGEPFYAPLVRSWQELFAYWRSNSQSQSAHK